MQLIFHITYSALIDKSRVFGRFLQIIHLLLENHWRHRYTQNRIRWVSWQNSWIIDKSQFNINKKIDQALTTSIVIQLGLISTVSAADAEIHKKNLGSAMTTLIISNEEMEDIKMIKNLEEPDL